MLTADPEQEKGLCRICEGSIIVRSPFEDGTVVLRCDNCHTETLRPFPSLDQIRQHYTDYSVTDTPDDQLLFLIDLCVESLKFYIAKMRQFESLKVAARFLEIGFGNGASLLAASRLGFEAYGVDLDSARVATLQSLSRKYATAVTCIQGDVTNIHDFGSKFDIVKISQVLEHVLDPVQFLWEVSEKQKVGGYLILESPNNEAAFWHLKNRIRKSFGRMNFYNSLKLKEHLWGYTKKSLGLLLKGAGYDVLFITDYASGNAVFEPQSVIWYPSWKIGIKELILRRNWQPIAYSLVRTIDALSSQLFGLGTGLAVLSRKMSE